MGYLQIIDPSEGRHLDEKTIAEIFDNPDREPAEPPRGLIEEPALADPSFLDELINIQALDPWVTTYKQFLYIYHDVISKGKFDLGWTDVVDDDPVHIYMPIQDPARAQADNLRLGGRTPEEGSNRGVAEHLQFAHLPSCLLYTSDAADE